MKTRDYIIYGLLIILMPVLVWLIYCIGKNYFGIPTSLSAGDILAYLGSILAAFATIYAVIITINHNKEELEKQNKEQRKLFLREIQKAFDEKMYDEICDMSKDIMVYLCLYDLLSMLHSVLHSSTVGSIPDEEIVLLQENENIDKARAAIASSRTSLMVLHKKQWYYHERLEREGVFLDRNDDVEFVKAYFRYIYELLNSLEDLLARGSDISERRELKNFFKAVDSFRVDNQYAITERTGELVKGLKNVLISRWGVTER